MKLNQSFDYIIAGAGASGLSLLWHILQEKKLCDKKILVVDRSLKWISEKTWCFWNTDLIPFEEMIAYTWNQIEVRSKGRVFQQTDSIYTYNCIHSTDFRQAIFDMAEKSGRVTILEESVLQFGVNNGMAYMDTDAGRFFSDYIFQSLPDPHRKSTEKLILQHFRGHTIQSRRSIFNPEKATLMDFDRNMPANGLSFFYVLPYSKKRALVEYTIFSPKLLEKKEYDLAIKTYLKNRFSLEMNDYNILDVEEGIIPMDDKPVPDYTNSRTLNIGTAGGATKPTTGYTFTRIQQHCADIVNALVNCDTPPAFPESPARFRLYDRLLIDILKNNPAAAPSIFHRLFKKNSFDNVLTFLDESTNLLSEARIFNSLPKTPFIFALLKTMLSPVIHD